MFCCIKCISSILRLERALRPKAFKCCGQRFATSTAQSCATLPLHALPATRMQSPDVPGCGARASLLLPETGPTLLPGFVLPSCTESLSLLLQAYVSAYFATSSSAKSPARIALILGRGNYLLEMTEFGASTLPATLTVLTAGVESCAAALLSRKPRLVSEN